MPAMLPACDALPALVTACPAATQRAPAPSATASPCPWPGSRSYCQPRATTPIPGEVPLTPLYNNARSAPDIKNFAYDVSSPGKPRHGTPPPGIDSPPKFYKQKTRLCRGLRWPGAVAASGPGLADPWPRSRVTPAPLPLVCPFAGRGGPVSGPVRRRFIVPGGGLGVHFRLQVSPPFWIPFRHLREEYGLTPPPYPFRQQRPEAPPG